MTLKQYIVFGAAIAVTAMIASIFPAFAQMKQYGDRHASNATRACIPSTTQQSISTSTASAASTILTTDANHYVVCDTDTFVRWAGTAPTAAATDFLLPANTIFPFFTGLGQADFFAGILASGTGTCTIIECE